MSEAHKVLAELRKDLSQMQQRVTELTRILNEHNLTDKPRPRCPHCGLSFKHQTTLDEHIYTSHAGPEPPHWLHAETLTEQPTTIEEVMPSAHT